MNQFVVTVYGSVAVDKPRYFDGSVQERRNYSALAME